MVPVPIKELHPCDSFPCPQAWPQSPAESGPGWACPSGQGDRSRACTGVTPEPSSGYGAEQGAGLRVGATSCTEGSPLVVSVALPVPPGNPCVLEVLRP